MLAENIRDIIHQHNDHAKRAAFEALHRANGRVTVMLQANKATPETGIPVGVLERYVGKMIPLDIGARLARPTHFSTDERCLHARLSFSGVDYSCVIPWRIVGSMYSDPKADAFAWAHVTPEVEAPVAPTRGGLRVIQGGAG